MRTTNTTDAQKIVDTLFEFCPGIDGGIFKTKQSELNQSISRTQLGSTHRGDQSTLLTESQMGGRGDWQPNDNVVTQQVSPSAVSRRDDSDQLACYVVQRYESQGPVGQDGFRKPPPLSQIRQRATLRMDAENIIDQHHRSGLELNRSTDYHHRVRSSQASVDPYSPMATIGSEAPVRQPYTPALSLRGGPEPDRYQYNQNRQHEAFNRDRIIAPATIEMNDVFTTPARKRPYEEYPESYTQVETITPVQFPLHSNSSPRRASRHIQDFDFPFDERNRSRQRLPLAESYENQAYAFNDPPLIDMDAPSIRWPPTRTKNREESIHNSSRLRPQQEEGGQIKQGYAMEDDAVLARIRTKTGLYSLDAEDLESVVHEILAEDGFADFVGRSVCLASC